MEDLNIGSSEIAKSSLIAISAHSNFPVDLVAMPNENLDLCNIPSRRLDAQIKGLIKCESCPKTFMTPGTYRYVPVLFRTIFGADSSVSDAIAKRILYHTVATAAEALDLETILIDIKKTYTGVLK